MKRGWRLLCTLAQCPAHGSDAWRFRMALLDALKLRHVLYELNDGPGNAVLICVKAKDSCCATSIRMSVAARFPADVTLDQGREAPANPKAPAPEKKEPL